MSTRMTSAEFQRTHGSPFGNQIVGKAKPQIRLPSKRGPNKVESEWMRICETRHPKRMSLLYEPFTFKLPSGTRYTPDVVVVDGNLQGAIITCYEVKGPHLHGNSANSIRAFKEARATYYWMNFIFAQHTKGGWACA